MALTEFEIIRRFFAHRARRAVLGVGDDAAIVRACPGYELVITTDMLLCGTHFSADADPARLGHKALAVNLSDIAAMGAAARWATLAIALPRPDARWLSAFTRGFLRLARRWRVDLVGGDTTRGPLAISVQVVGEVPAGQALRRDGARAGDEVWVSGTLGDAAVALAARAGRVRLGRALAARLARRLDAPAPRLALGQRLRGIASSAIDVSDGLLADLGHICERSGVGAIVELARVPRSAALRAMADSAAVRSALLAGGDDYELCFTAPPARRGAVARIGRRLGLRLTRIGRIVPRARGAPPVTVVGPGGRPLAVSKRGYEHFG